MSEQKKPQAGEWWFVNGRNDRVYIVGVREDGKTIFQTHKGGDMLPDFDGNWSSWHHEPRCTGWDWQPEPEPEWFDLTPFDQHTYRKCDEAFHPHDNKWQKRHMANGVGALVFELKRIGYTQFRCLLKDAPPELVAMASKPAEDPDEWVTQDRVEERLCDQRRVCDVMYGADSGWRNGQISGKRHGHEYDSGYMLELRCRRRDLPPMPESKPATQTMVFHECIVKQGCPPDYYTLEWVCDVPKHSNWIPTGRTKTREVNRG